MDTSMLWRCSYAKNGCYTLTHIFLEPTYFPSLDAAIVQLVGVDGVNLHDVGYVAIKGYEALGLWVGCHWEIWGFGALGMNEFI